MSSAPMPTSVKKAMGEKPLKQPRMQGEVEVQRKQEPPPPMTPDSRKDGEEESASGQAGSPTSILTVKRAPPHPKGHRVRELKDIWAMMDAGEYLRCTDTYALSDVWIQPVEFTPLNKSSMLVKFKEIVLGTHVKEREAQNKMYCEDILKMFYLADQYENEFGDRMTMTFENWQKSAVSAFVQCRGVDDVSDRAALCKFLFDTKRVSFFPLCCSRNIQLFFRKTSCHSYKQSGMEKKKKKNLSVIKCVGARGSFEYLWEARIVWIESGEDAEDDLPATQPLPADI